MFKIWLVLKREYLSQVRNRVFWITTLLAPLGIVVLTVGPALFTIWGGSTVQNIAVVDQTGSIASHLRNSEQLRLESIQADLNQLKQTYQAQGYTGILVIPAINLADPVGITLYTTNPLGFESQIELEHQLNQAITQNKIDQAKLDQQLIASLETKISLKNVLLDAGGEKSANTGLATGLGYAMGFIIYMFLFVYGSMVMNGVLEEKTSRVVEVIISSVKPLQLMLGKIIGIALVGLTQVVLWAVLGFAILTMVSTVILPLLGSNPSSATSNTEISVSQTAQIQTVIQEVQNLNWPQIISLFIFYFLGGYLLYASLFAAVGAAADNPRDAGSLLLPVTVPIIFSIVILFNILQNPNGPLAIWTSIFPLTSPIIMLARIPFGVPWWQIGISMLVLLLGFFGTAWIAAKIYRVGILAYGQKVSFRDLWKWVRSNR